MAGEDLQPSTLMSVDNTTTAQCVSSNAATQCKFEERLNEKNGLNEFQCFSCISSWSLILA